MRETISQLKVILATDDCFKYATEQIILQKRTLTDVLLKPKRYSNLQEISRLPNVLIKKHLELVGINVWPILNCCALKNGIFPSPERARIN